MHAGFLDEPLTVLAGADHVRVGLAHLRRHVDVHQVELGDEHSGLVKIQRLLQHPLGFLADLLSGGALQNVVQTVGAHGFTQGALRRMAQGRHRVAHLEQEILGIVDAVLDLVVELDQVLVLGEHVAAIVHRPHDVTDFGH